MIGTVTETNPLVHTGTKGQKVTIIKGFSYNGEGHYLTKEIGEIPDIFIDIVQVMDSELCDNWKICDSCEEAFQEGWTLDEGYFCSEKCIDNSGTIADTERGYITYKKFLKLYAESEKNADDDGNTNYDYHNTNYWTSWADQNECNCKLCEGIGEL